MPGSLRDSSVSITSLDSFFLQRSPSFNIFSVAGLPPPSLIRVYRYHVGCYLR